MDAENIKMEKTQPLPAGRPGSTGDAGTKTNTAAGSTEDGAHLYPKDVSPELCWKVSILQVGDSPEGSRERSNAAFLWEGECQGCWRWGKGRFGRVKTAGLFEQENGFFPDVIILSHPCD